MTGGGLYVLVAYGSQNVILSGNPDFTYFYMVLKKYSHFSFESATLQVEGPNELFFDQPIQIRAKIQRIGDLLSDLYFTFTLPDIYSKYVDATTRSQYEFQWVRYIGAQIIQDASLFIGGTLVQQIDSDYIIASALTDQDETQYNKWQELVGDVADLYDPAHGSFSGQTGNPVTRTPGLYPTIFDTSGISQQSNYPSIPGREITLPLGFWFSQSPHLALPLIALQYHECEVQLTLRPIQDLYTVLDPSGSRVRPENMLSPTTTIEQLQSGNVSYAPSTEAGIYIRHFLTDAGYGIPTLNTWPLNPRLQATYIYLTEDERRTFATKSLIYPVRQVTRYPFPNNTTRKYFELFTHNPVPRLIILPRRSDALQHRNAWTNYTNWLNYPNAPYIPPAHEVPFGLGSSGALIPGIQQDIIRQIRILCDGNEIQEAKPIQYFKELSSWKYATGVFPAGLAIYSFALDTSKWMKPSGSLNTSRVKMFQIDIDMWPLATDSNFMMDYVIYVESLNFFVVEGGMGGMKYAS